MGNKELSQGIRKYIRRQKLLIKKSAKSAEEEKENVRRLLSRYYKSG